MHYLGICGFLSWCCIPVLDAIYGCGVLVFPEECCFGGVDHGSVGVCFLCLTVLENRDVFDKRIFHGIGNRENVFVVLFKI